MSQESKLEYRIGSSRDIHTLSLNRKLILGALALGDLGTHFPDNDPNTENMDSAIIVRYVVKKMKEAGYKVNNVDIFISLEEPKLKDYIPKMKYNVSFELDIPYDTVSIKAGTNEGIGAVGEKHAVEAACTVLLKRVD